MHLSAGVVILRLDIILIIITANYNETHVIGAKREKRLTTIDFFPDWSKDAGCKMIGSYALFSRDVIKSRPRLSRLLGPVKE